MLHDGLLCTNITQTNKQKTDIAQTKSSEFISNPVI